MTEDIDRISENNQALNTLLGEVVKPVPLNDVLGNCLDVLLTLSWLSFLPKAGIFLTRINESGECELELVAERNMDAEIKASRSKVSFGPCLCGRTADTQSTVHATCIDGINEPAFEGIQPDECFNIPITSRGETLGVIVFFLPEGSNRHINDVAFLERVADTLALVILLNRQSDALSQKMTELDYQKLALDEHAIVSVTDTKGTIKYANDKFCAMSGYSQDELIGSNHRILKSGEHSPEFYRELWRTIASGRIWHGEIKNQKKRGGYYWVTSTIVPFLGPDGKPFQYVAIRTDITAEKKKEQELARAHEAAEAANTAKSEFLATMSHEIRTPMTGVIGFADLLLHEELDGKSKDLVHKIKSSTRSLLRIINDILDISKLDAGKVELEYIDFHLPSLIAEVVDFFSDDYSGGGGNPVKIETDLPDKLPPGINMDPTRLRQVLINLIGNARKFTETGTITVKCRLTGDGTREPKLHFSVRDTGIGIKPEVLGMLFTEFKQGDASITRKFEGTGLGLAICKKLVSLMCGEIGAASVYGKGSTFWFSLPYKPARTPVSVPDDKNVPSTYFAARRPLHVLVVDDNKMNQQIVTAILKSFGHTFETADNGRQAVEMHEAKEFDLILMDVRMPVMSGTDATRMIRKMNSGKNAVPIIALTADAMEEHRKEFYEAGMDAVVIKPIDIALLASTMNMALGETINVPVGKPKNTLPVKAADDTTATAETTAAVSDFLRQIGASNDIQPEALRPINKEPI